MQFLLEHANNGRLIVTGLSLSLLGVLGVVANRVFHASKGRKETPMSRNAYQPISYNCASSTGATARAVEPARTKKNVESCPPRDHDQEVPFVSPVTSSFKVKAVLKIGQGITQPPIDLDDIVYLDE